MDQLTYPEIGATRHGALPAGYRHLEYRTRLCPGGFAVAGEAVMRWRMHEAAGVRIRASAPRAATGERVTCAIGFGPVRVDAPCVVVWTVETDDRIGFGYGTLAGHPAVGEESFLVSRDPDGAVWFSVTAFSRPAYRVILGAWTP